MGGFQNFAISFTIISILAGCLTSYSIAWNQGGPLEITWGWLIVGFFCTLVAFVDGRDRLDVPDRRRPLLLGLEARRPRVGMVHRLVQPHRPDRRHGRDRIRVRDLHDLAAEPVVQLPELVRLHLPDVRDHPARGRADQHVQGPDHGVPEHVLCLVAHGRRARHRLRLCDRPRPPPVGQLRLHPDRQQHRLRRRVDVRGDLLLRLPDGVPDGPVHDHGLRRLRAHERGDPQRLDRRRLGHGDVGRRLGVLRVHPARGGHVRDPGQGAVGHLGLHRPEHLAGLDGETLGGVPDPHRRRRAVLLHDRVDDVGLADDVRLLA